MLKQKKYNLIKNIFLSLIIFNIHQTYIQSYITLPFTYINKKTNTTNPPITSIKSYYETYLENSIYTSMKLSDKKEIKFHLTFDRYATYISQSLLKNLDINPSLLYDEEKEEKLFSLEYIGIARSTFGNYSFNFKENNTRDISINNISFFISKKLLDELPSLIKSKFFIQDSAEFGFNIFKGNKISQVEVEEDDPFEDLIPPENQDDDDEDEYEYGGGGGNKNKEIKGEKYINKNNGYEIEENSNLINQLKSKKIINSYTFSIKYDENENKGNFILGSAPHEYDPRHYNEKYFAYSNIIFKKETPCWKLIFEDIKYGEEKLLSSNMAEFNINFGFITASITLKDYFDTAFFKKEENIKSCFEEEIKDSYHIKYCKKDVIKNFKSLNFFLPKPYSTNIEQKFEFNYEDLFIKCPFSDNNDDFYCFQIVFKGIYTNWILGKPLFKKYQMVFDQEKKIIGFYKETGVYEYDELDQNKKEGKNTLPWILVWILFFGLIILGFLFYKKVINGIRRKKIANELEDDFVYELSVKKHNENDDENKNKLFKFGENN